MEATMVFRILVSTALIIMSVTLFMLTRILRHLNHLDQQQQQKR